MPAFISTWAVCLDIFPWPLSGQHTQCLPWRVLCRVWFVNLTQFTGPSQHGSTLCFITLESLLCPYFVKGSNVMHQQIRRDGFSPHFYLFNLPSFLSADGWGWRGTRSVVAVRVSIAERNGSWQNGSEKFKIPSIKKIVWLLHALSLTDQLIIPSLLSFPLSPSLLSCLCWMLSFPRCLADREQRGDWPGEVRVRGV